MSEAANGCGGLQVIQLKRYTEKLVMHRRLLSMAHAELGA
jgi:hypothetical protein